MGKVTLIATAAMGIEALVAREVRDLGYECQVENSKVTFEADEKAICRTNLWLRTADSVKLKLANLKQQHLMSYLKNESIKLGDYIPENGEFPVIGKSLKSELFSVSDCQRIVKKLSLKN